MEKFLELLSCPVCRGDLSPDLSCRRCFKQYEAPDGIPNLRLESDAPTEAVRSFYEQSPFPGYPRGASLSWLHARAERSEFARLLEQAIPGDARIVDLGCGTGQMSLYLARGRRVVIGADLTRRSLQLASEAARRFELSRVLFVETDLRCPGLRESAFDVVYSSGVLHHTRDPRQSFSRIANLARPGGWIVLGLYNMFGRIPMRLRRLVARLTGYRTIPFDPVLRDRRNEQARCLAWLRDQYHHLEEHRHTLNEVQSWFHANNVEYVRAYPSALVGEDSDDLFAFASDSWTPEAWVAQLSWIRTLAHEGGLFVTVGRRK